MGRHGWGTPVAVSVAHDRRRAWAVVVLSIGKLGRGAESYYLQAVATGVEDYYVHSGEAPGRWIGTAAQRLGLSGTVAAEELRTVLDGRNPTTGRSLITARRPDRLPGLDLTFSAPKSVSLLFALSDETTSLTIRRAHDAAVTQALSYLEREASEVRRGKDGIDRLPGQGFVAAAFRHRTSRAGDPQLHTHVLVANMTCGTDGKWSALDGRQLYWQAKTAGMLYQSALRHGLRQLGLQFVLKPNGTCEIAGVPTRVLRAFSQRRTEIEAELANRGETSRKAAQVATLATRKAKDYGVHPASLAAEWRARAEQLGFDAATRAKLFNRGSAEPAGREVLLRGIRTLVGEEGLTARSPVFDRRDVLRGWCTQLPSGASVSAIEQLADQLLTQRVVIPIDAPVSALQPGAERSFARHTTRDMLAVERRTLHTALARRTAGVAIADPVVLEKALAARASLSAEQVAMVRRLTSSGAGVDVVIGKPGTGKSHALAAATETWQANGTAVIGTAVAARTAIALSETAGMPAITVARLLREVQNAGLPRGVVVVVDEAGMLPTRQLAQLIAATAAAHGKLVLVGDDKQLPELAAGGAFYALARHLHAATLIENRRQSKAWEREALDQLRAGQIEPALNSYTAAGRINTAPSTAEQREALVTAWWAAQQQQSRGGETVMLAARRADVADLNERARTMMIANGRLTGPSVSVHTEHGQRNFATGDIVIARRNNYRAGILNGQRGTITHIDPERRSVTLTVRQRQVTVGANYLEAGSLDHGYALTIHQAQGLTTGRTLILGNDSLYRESGYVALSRGRERNDLYTATQPDNLDPVLHDGHVPEPRNNSRRDVLSHLGETLQRSRRQTMAIEVLSRNHVPPTDDRGLSM
jgi:conjugative relaxase-like TrwC/TraI family protein